MRVVIQSRFFNGLMTPEDRKQIDKGYCPNCLIPSVYERSDKHGVSFKCHRCGLLTYKMHLE